MAASAHRRKTMDNFKEKNFLQNKIPFRFLTSLFAVEKQLVEYFTWYFMHPDSYKPNYNTNCNNFENKSKGGTRNETKRNGPHCNHCSVGTDISVRILYVWWKCKHVI